MEHNQTYEKIVKKKCVGRHRDYRLMAYLGYAAFALLWVAPIIRSLFSPTMILLAVLTTVSLILCTKSYLHVEYEYAFVEDSLTISKIYGKRRRKTLYRIDLKELLLVAPYTKDYEKDIESLAPKKTLDTLSSPDSENVLCAIFEKDEDTRILLLLETDARATAFFRRYAPHVCAREIRSNLQ